MWVVVLVEEVPADTKSEHSLIERVVRRKEICVYVHDRVVAHFCAVVALLYGILSECWIVVGSIVLCEESCIGSEVAFQYTCNLEPQEQICVYVNVGHRQRSLVR